MNILAQIRDKEIDLANTSGSLIADRAIDTIIKSSSQDYYPSFDEGDPLNWSVDPDKLDDLATAKE